MFKQPGRRDKLPPRGAHGCTGNIDYRRRSSISPCRHAGMQTCIATRPEAVSTVLPSEVTKRARRRAIVG